MDKGYVKNGCVENGFIVDVSSAHKSSEIIYELSNVLDLPDAQCKKVCLKLGAIDLNPSQLMSIKALVECMNSEIEFITTASVATLASAEELGIQVSELENKIPVPEFNTASNVNQEVEKALDRIFSDGFSDIEDYEYDDAPVTEVDFEEEVATEESVISANKPNRIYDEDGNDITEEVKASIRATENLPTLYVQRTIRSGQSITSEGNLVVIGDVHPGSEIIAKGDITVWGVLGGIAQAGSPSADSEGNRYAKIRALKMNAIQLRIADIFSRRPDDANIPYIQKTETFTPEEASVRKTQIIIQKLKREAN